MDIEIKKKKAQATTNLVHGLAPEHVRMLN